MEIDNGLEFGSDRDELSDVYVSTQSTHVETAKTPTMEVVKRQIFHGRIKMAMTYVKARKTDERLPITEHIGNLSLQDWEIIIELIGEVTDGADQRFYDLLKILCIPPPLFAQKQEEVERALVLRRMKR